MLSLSNFYFGFSTIALAASLVIFLLASKKLDRIDSENRRGKVDDEIKTIEEDVSKKSFSDIVDESNDLYPPESPKSDDNT